MHRRSGRDGDRLNPDRRQPLSSAATPTPSSVDSRLKAAFVQFLWLRHGGSGYIFGNGSAGVDQNRIIPFNNPPAGASTVNYPQGIPAERPFHSLSYPDIDYTVMRPNTLPPSLFTNPQPNAVPVPTATPPTYYTGDPGVRNPNSYAGYSTAGIPTGNSASTPPVRTLSPGDTGTPALPGPRLSTSTNTTRRATPAIRAIRRSITRVPLNPTALPVVTSATVATTRRSITQAPRRPDDDGV